MSAVYSVLAEEEAISEKEIMDMVAVEAVAGLVAEEDLAVEEGVRGKMKEELKRKVLH